MLQTCSLQKEAQKNTIGRNQWEHNWIPCPSYEMKINSCPIAGANLVSQILSVHFYPSNRTEKSVVVWIITSLVCQDRVCKLGWQWCITIQWSHVWDFRGYCLLCLCISFVLASKCAVVFHFSSALSVHDWW